MIEISENVTPVLGVMIPIVAIVGGLSLAFGIRYLRSRERMEMISRGMDVSALRDLDMAQNMAYRRNGRNPMRTGFVLLAIGIGLLISYTLCHTVLPEGHNGPIYFGVIAICIGIAFVMTPPKKNDDKADPR